MASEGKDENAIVSKQITSLSIRTLLLPQECVQVRDRQDSEDFKKRLRKELVNRDGHRELTKSTKFVTLAFANPDLEKAYYQHTESFSSVTLQAFLVVRLAIGISQFIVLPR